MIKMLSTIMTEGIVPGLFGLGGMLVGGLVVYHRVERMINDLQAEISRLDADHKLESDKIWERFNTVQEMKVCLAERKSCVVQFSGFRDGQAEIKQLFRELQLDLKTELRLLRECISAVTSGKC